MENLFILYVLSLAVAFPVSSYSKLSDTLTEGSSLSVEKPNDVLASSDGVFSAGFFAVGVNAYCFAVWFNEPHNYTGDRTVVWMANRDSPVNGKGSKLTLLKTGSLVLTDTDWTTVWSTATLGARNLVLRDSGNVVLLSSDGAVVWQSFDSPTDTLVTGQPLTRYARLVASRSRSNFSSGFYKLFFDNDNVLRLIFDNNELSGVYWPSPWLLAFNAGRETYNNTRIAGLDSTGSFTSSDDFAIVSADHGSRRQRMIRVDSDGNVRLYSRKSQGEAWAVTWQSFNNPCKIHGLCGDNSLCTYDPIFGRKCSCVPGHKPRNDSDWSYGCEPEFKPLSCGQNESGFYRLFNTEFYGYDTSYTPNYTLEDCKKLCLQMCNCKGFQYLFSIPLGYFRCYPKTLLVNGHHRPDFPGDIYLRLPMSYLMISGNKSAERVGLNCSDQSRKLLERTYTISHEGELVRFMLWFAIGMGGLELGCILLVWWLAIRTRKSSGEDFGGYILAAATGFKRFPFAELKKATRDFSEEIGRGSGGVVYKAILSDLRIAAVKRLTEAHQGEAEFLAEVNTIGRLNHMNLIEMWGYCAEGKHRLLVYEYLEHGSLKENLSSNVLDWEKRFEIAVGTAKGLAYIHEECLEWILHCDVKPQNILLGSNYEPKVADFGLSKLLQRGEPKNTSFSRIRGTRGYMAPEWVTNQTITSKVDVYSYGIVLLEILTGKSPSDHDSSDSEETQSKGLFGWVKEKVNGGNETASSCAEKIIDTSMEGQYDKEKVGILLDVALKCMEEEKAARPTMRQVVEMLQDH